MGDYKIITGWQPSGPFGTGSNPSCSNISIAPGTLPGGWAAGGKAGVDCSCGEKGCLYHLPSDPLEAHDIAATEPTILAVRAKFQIPDSRTHALTHLVTHSLCAIWHFKLRF